MPLPRLYADTAAGAPLRPAAAAEMARALQTLHGNPSSPHAEGRAAKDALEEARSRIAAVLGCRPREVLFTSGGTEAANLGLSGAARARREASPRLVCSAVEHPCVADAARRLAEEGFELEVPAVDARGQVEAEAFAARARGAVLAALMAANHETGNVLPVEAVARGLEGSGTPLLVDASLAPGRLPLAPLARAADLLVLSGPKSGGPKGIGVLRVRRGVRLVPLFAGGLQEDRARPGTENVAAALGLAAALEEAEREAAARAACLEAWVADLLGRLGDLGGWRALGDPARRLPGLVTLELDGVEGEAVMINLDLEGVAVATGSTCALGGTTVSPSLLAMGLTPRRASSTVRLSPGHEEPLASAARVATALADVVRRLRALAHGAGGSARGTRPQHG